MAGSQGKRRGSGKGKGKSAAARRATGKAKRSSKAKTKSKSKREPARKATALGSQEIDRGAALRGALAGRSTPATRDSAPRLPASVQVTSVIHSVLAAQSSATPLPAWPAELSEAHQATDVAALAHRETAPPREPARPSKSDAPAAAEVLAEPAPRAIPRPSVAHTPWQASAWTLDDQYALPSSLGELDLHLIGEGTHRRLWEVLGSHPRRMAGDEGASFAVWAPNAKSVSVVGDFCDWDPTRYPMRPLGVSGVHELWVPGVKPGDLYKYAIEGLDGVVRLKTDPLAFKHEQWPGTAGIVQRLDHHVWGDQAWMSGRARRDATREPLAILELQLSSWRRVPEEDNRPLGYREAAPLLVEHCRRFGFTHVELMPVMEHPFGGSWGYQVTGYFAPTSRHGTPDDFRYLVDTLHQAGLGVILDWVPAHFPDDAHSLERFDGTALYEHEDPRLARHPDWHTLIFNYGRNEVRNFLVASALYWLKELHADGLRVDAVASMLYRDYSRKDGEWLPNKYGGRENLEAIDFLRILNATVQQECPGTLMLAEESTAWGGVTAPPDHGGLGFTFKWNMGWMHDTLRYFARDPIHRRWHHDEITFAMLYEHSERFLNPLSHDEVVHGKGSLLGRLPGDEWQKLAQLRLLLAYQYLRPGKKLLFMGTELASPREWDHDQSLDWHLANDPPRRGLARFLEDLGRLYLGHAALWRSDPDPEGFQWIDCSDRENSVLAWARRDVGDTLVVVLNLTPVPRRDYRIGIPSAGRWSCIFSSDAGSYGGSDYATRDRPTSEPVPLHGQEQSLVLDLPPLSALVLRPA
ncbi:MAG: 1,4-alpha-glucan branching protein GlgB [Planctomycetota bacterium]